jgi:hypothetical protein
MIFTDKQKVLIELCVRRVLCDLLNEEETAINNFCEQLHNLNVGCFGEKEFKFEDTDDWIDCLQDLRGIIATLDPIYQEKIRQLGCKPYICPSEKKRMENGCLGDNSKDKT